MIFCKKYGLSTATAAQSEKIEKATAANPRINISAFKALKVSKSAIFKNKIKCHVKKASLIHNLIH